MNDQEKDAHKQVLYDLLKTWDWSIDSDFDFDTPGPNRDFYIQFTVMKWDKNYREWRLECLIEHPGTERIYDPNVEYADANHVKLKSYKHNWSKTWLLDSRDPKKDEIPLRELYSDFKEHKYEGVCIMR